ncbi:MAG: response regulator [Bacteroidaceae bacterium]|nr:response regulator [Bacteroidaceae bacterium]
MVKRFTILTLMLLSVVLISAQRTYWYTTEDNISNNRFQTICEDKNGFIWIGTENGLNKYDGYEFVNFFQNPNDTLSLMSNYIRTLFCDSNGIMWVGTSKGLQYIYPNDTKLHTVNMPDYNTVFITKILELNNGDICFSTSGRGVYKISPANLSQPEKMSKVTEQMEIEVCRTILEDRNGTIWVGTPIGVSIYDPATMRLTHFKRDIINRDITSINEDNEGGIFISTNNHIYLWDSFDDTLERITPEEGVWEITHTFMDNEYNLYVSLRGNGLLKYNRENKTLERVKQSIGDIELDHLDVSALYRDSQGNMWLGCFLSGLAMTTRDTNQFGYYRFADFKENISGVVTALMQDNNGNLWIGYNNKGLTCINPEGIVSINNRNQPYISCFYQSKDGKIWVGLTSGGLSLLDTENGDLEPIIRNEYAAIYTIVEDSHGYIYFSELGQGFTRHIPGDTTTTTWSDMVSKDSEYTLSNDWIYAMFIDNEDLLWLGHDNGIDCYDLKTNRFLDVARIRQTVSATSCYVIKEDSKERLWFGTNMGLMMFDRSADIIKLYTESEGLSDKVINGIEEDENGNIWVSTQSGLNKLNPETSTIDRYYSGAGLRDRTYNKVSAGNSNSGMIFFASNNGITYFNPKNINTSTMVNDILLTSFDINNEPILLSNISNSQFTDVVSLMEADFFNLSYKDNSITLEFTTLNFGEEDCISYEYTFDASRAKWSSTPTGVNTINFSHLNPGIHKLSVRARMNDSLSNVKTFSIRVTPPWYLSIYAYCAYGILIILLIIFIIRAVRKRGEQNVSEAKLQAFTNIAHEICTPMTMIISPLEELMAQDDLNVSTHKQLQQMHKSSTKILSLIHQLLDLRKYDEGQMNIHYKEVDFVNFIMGTFELYTQTAERREIDFTYIHTVEELPIYIDVDSLDKVMMNLLSNAFKYTSDGGSIEVKLDVGIDESKSGPLRNYAQVSISDNGIGMDIEDVTRVFDRFYRAQNTLTSMTLGMGIGLNFCRALIDLHRGEIWAENRTDTKGSVFTFRLPLGKAHIKEDDIDIDNESVRKELSMMRFSETELMELESNPSHYRKVLVVDDDDSMLEYISTNLRSIYKVITCKNGLEGLRMAISQKPDLVITDVVMPEMDGITLLRKLKMNVDTSHIPVIVLSGKNKLQDRMLGIETGADAYLPKPFYMNELKSTAANLISNRLIMKGKFSGNQEQKTIVESVHIESTDEQFMKQVVDLINKNLSNSEFNVEQMMRDLRVSKSKLNRKIKDITGFSPARFIQNIRMQQAKVLLNKTLSANISEIAYEVGFSSQTHFSTTFKSFFGITPSEYLKQKGINNEEQPETTAE